MTAIFYFHVGSAAALLPKRVFAVGSLDEKPNPTSSCRHNLHHNLIPNDAPTPVSRSNGIGFLNRDGYVSLGPVHAHINRVACNTHKITGWPRDCNAQWF